MVLYVTNKETLSMSVTAFSPFPTMFLKASFSGASKVVMG